MSHPVTSAPARARARDPRSREYMVRYSGSPIRHTEFGIRESGFGIRGTGNLHGAVFSLLTRMDMVR
jgi:hypothetical protein